MYDEIGGKIKTLAKVIAWVGIIVSVVVGIVTISTGVGILVLVLGPLFSWLSTLVLYGFGQLVENTDILVHQNMFYQPNSPYYKDQTNNFQPDKRYDNVDNLNNNQATNSFSGRMADSRLSEKYCPNCQKVVVGNFCPYCGTPDLKDMSMRNSK